MEREATAFGLEIAAATANIVPSLTYTVEDTMRIETERHEPTPSEEARSIEASADKLTVDRESARSELLQQAEARGENRGSAADLLLLSTEAWRRRDFDSTVRLAAVNSVG